MYRTSQYRGLMRALRMTAFLAKNPVKEVRAIVAACVAERICAKR
jgi:hypothetical protein